MKRFFDNLNSEVYFFREHGIRMNPNYYDETERKEHNLYGTKKNGEFGILGKYMLILVSEKSWEFKFTFKHNGVKITETYKVPDAPPSGNRWSKPCYTTGESLCGNYICKVESHMVPYYPRRCLASGSIYLRIQKKYYTQRKTKRARKKTKKFTPNFEKPSTSSYY